MKIYHNPRCRKSRETLGIIKSAKVNPEIVEYLNSPPTENELKNILKMLEISPLDLLRKGESIYKEKYKGKKFNEENWIKIMVKNPILIERPIVVKNGKAILGRPPENVKIFL